MDVIYKVDIIAKIEEAIFQAKISNNTIERIHLNPSEHKYFMDSKAFTFDKDCNMIYKGIIII